MASQQHTQKHCYISGSTLKRPISRPRQSQQVELSSANQNVRHRRGNQVKAFAMISIALVEFLGLRILVSRADESHNAYRGMSLRVPPGAQGLRGMGTREAQNVFNSGAFSKKRMQCHVQSLGKDLWPPRAPGPHPHRLWLGGRDCHRRAGRSSAFLPSGAGRVVQGGFISRVCTGPVYSLLLTISMFQLNL